MPYKRTASPSAVLSLADAKTHLRVDHSDDDSYITALIQVATDSLDGRDGWLGRALATQTWQYTGPIPTAVQIADLRFLAKWPATYVKLELPPVQTLTEVACLISGTYTAQTLTNFQVRAMKGYSVVRPINGQSWPTMDDDEECLRITFTTGEATCPTPIVHAIKLLVGSLYELRSEEMYETSRATLETNPAFKNLLAPYKVWTI